MAESIEQQLALGRDELLQRLGKHLTPVSVLPRSPSELRAIALRWIEERRAQLQAAVCGSEEIRALSKSAQANERRVILATMIADTIAASIVGVPAITLAVLIVQEGVETLCGSDWLLP